jgi:hypothetical protein
MVKLKPKKIKKLLIPLYFNPFGREEYGLVDRYLHPTTNPVA